MARQFTPQEKDRLASEAATGRASASQSATELPPNEQPAESPPPQPESGAPTWLWGIVGVIVLLAVAGGVILGFFGGRLFERAQLGTPVPRSVTGMLGAEPVNTPNGVRLDRVVSGGPAAEAGLQSGDYLLSIDGEVINTTTEVQEIISRHEAGDELLVVVRREFQMLETSLWLGTALLREPLPPQTAVTVIPIEPLPGYQSGRLGIKYRMLAPGASRAEGALVVAFLEEGTPAERSGLQVGDIITAVEDQAITEWSDLEDALGRFSAGDRVRVRIDRAGTDMTVEVRLG